MIRKIAIVLITLSFGAAPVAMAAAPTRWPTVRRHHTPEHLRLGVVSGHITLDLRSGHPQVRCGQYIVGVKSNVTITSVRVNGHGLPDNSPDGGLTKLYAGHGTLVLISAKAKAAPLCAKAITWQSHVHLLITYRVWNPRS